MSGDERARFQTARFDLEAILTGALQAFAAWHAREGQFREGAESWAGTYGEPYPGDEWVAAYNAGVTSVLGSLDCFLEDQGL
jgi:hypothetical protein